MKAALLVESLTGNTWKAAELIADDLRQEGWTITGLDRVRTPDLAAIQDADIVLVGTWVHGLFVVGQAPWALSTISNLPAMRGKRAAVFCTFALNPGKSLDKLTGAVQAHRRRRHRRPRPQPLEARASTARCSPAAWSTPSRAAWGSGPPEPVVGSVRSVEDSLGSSAAGRPCGAAGQRGGGLRCHRRWPSTSDAVTELQSSEGRPGAPAAGWRADV